MRTALVGVAVACLGSPVRGQGVIHLATAGDVTSACAARAPGSVYSVALGSRGFAFEPYDAARARLRLDVRRGLRGDAGAFELVFHHIAGLEDGRESLELAVPLSIDEAGVILGDHARGAIGLRLTFELSGPADGSAVCATVHRGDREGIRAAIEPLAFELTRGGERLASGASPRFLAQQEAAKPRPVATPAVSIATPVMTVVGGPASRKVARAASALAPRLLDCYRIGLAGNPALRGAMAVGIELSAGGRVASANVELDGIDDQQVTGCVLRLVKTARFPGGSGRVSIPIRFSDRRSSPG
jgi:hypothetical protein